MAYARLLCGSASLVLVATASSASAQAQQPAAAESSQLTEVVVTATRQSDTVSRVALSITAVTQKNLDQEGVKTVQDLARTVPSVIFRRAGGEGNPDVAIRGITSTLGAPTTGIYLDDTPLQKRDNAGAASGNGTPFPQLFDLERVEILRGPQGTLYGGSAEGGAIRFITPQPSLDKYSVYARSEVSSTEGGGISYEGGVATGGPIVEDKLGFRASVFARHNAGWIDEVSIYDGHTIAPDVNSGDIKNGRLAFTWAATDRLKITPSFYYSQEHVQAEDIYWENIPQFTLNAGIFTNAGTVNGVKFDFPDKVFPGGTFGPYNQFGPGKTGNAIYTNTTGGALPAYSPKTTTLQLPTLTFDYAFDHMTVKSVTSLPMDRNEGYTGGQLGARTAILPTSTNAGFVNAAGVPVPGGTGAAAIILPGVPYEYSYFNFLNTQQGLIEELRFASAGDPQRLSWVGGIYYANTNQHQFTMQNANEDDVSNGLRGISEAWVLGNTNFAGQNISQRNLYVNDNELAAFGEANYLITSKLKATVGVRITRSELTFNQATGSSVQGAAPGFVGTSSGTVTNPVCGSNPVSCNSATFHVFPNQATNGPSTYLTTFQGTQLETPVTPKFGLSYQANPRDLYYVTMAKGFREGGLNQPVPLLQCSQDLATLGLTSTPQTYNSDSVWSYEGGYKTRLFGGQAQLESSVFYIDWKNPQLQNRLRCGQNYIVNAGEAVSKGADIQGRARVGGFTFNGSVSYTNAVYTKSYVIPGTAGPITIVNKGDGLGSPDWQVNVGGQYDFRVFDRFGGYVRADYQYSGEYQRGVGPGASGYDPVTVNGSPTHFATARAGLTMNGWDWNVFVNNLTNSQDPLYVAHGAASALVTAATFRPREIGLQAAFRY
jgi:outer membrane receptor protein involved in Fe transport